MSSADKDLRESAEPNSSTSKSQNSPLPFNTKKREGENCVAENGLDLVRNTHIADEQNLDLISSSYNNLRITASTSAVPNVSVNLEKKKKNFRKREKKKQLNLQMPQPNQSNNEMHSAPVAISQVNDSLQFQQNSVNEMNLKHINNVNLNTNARYLENLACHPQFQHIMYSIQTRENNSLYSSSVPSSPNFQYVQQYGHPSNFARPNCFMTANQCNNVPVSPQMKLANTPANSSNVFHSQNLQKDFTIPKYMQNVMQHPILSKTFVNKKYCKPSIPNVSGNDKNLRQSKKCKKKENSDDYKFEPYITKDEMEQGLKTCELLEGVLRINPKQFQHAYVSSSDRSEKDVLIDGLKNRNRSLEGDVVVVKLINENVEEESKDDKQKLGKVVYIKEKVHRRTCVGVLKLMPDKNRQRALFVPRDHRVPRLNIPFANWPDNFYEDAKQYENTLFSAKIAEWTDTRFAVGAIICLVGESGDMVTESKAILAQNDLDTSPFGPEFRHLFPRLDYTIPEEEISLREDCRNLCIFSIDPSNCRDIDDAVSCRELENGNYEIGVHISDVAHFLTENTLLDEKVADKATTVYLVEKAYHMLPDELCMLCSLFPGVDKLAFSVFWEISKDAKIISHRFAKTIIHSCCQLTYDHAQAILEDKDEAESNFPELYNNFRYNDVCKAIKALGNISSILRKNRFEGGALRIDQPKVAFHLNPTNGLPDSFWIYESKESHQLIEEFMLLANMTVASKIQEDHPKLAFLRCHPPPSVYMLRQLATSLKPIGIELNISSAGELHKSISPHVSPNSKDKGKAMVLSMLCAKPMTRAKYFCADGCADEDFHHYALNVPLYTHFTSPIRRYADIMVHRLLAASLKYREVPNWEVDKVKMIAAQCNKQKYNAKKAGELSTELYTLKYIELHSPLVTEAVVVEVREKYIDVIIVSMGLNRRIFFNTDFPGEFKCIKNDAGMKLSKMELSWRATDELPEMKQVIEVFSILLVEMHKGDDMVKVETKIKRPI